MSIVPGVTRATGTRAALLLAFLILAVLSLLGATSAQAAAPETDPYIVVLEDDVVHPGAIAHRHEENRGAKLGHIYGTAIKGYSAELTPAELKAVRQDPNVAYVERDIRFQAAAQTRSTGFQRIFAPSNPTLDIDEQDDVQVNADVAVIDTGVASHPDLRVVARANCQVSGSGCVDNAGVDDYGHGTHVAGIIGALDNSFGVVGVAPGARIWSVKSGDSGGDFALSDVLAGVNWVTERAGQIEVANMSLGCVAEFESECVENVNALRSAIATSVDNGVVYVVSAGNDKMNVSGGSNYDATYPANYGDVIAVSSLADFDGKAGGAASTPPCTYSGYSLRKHGESEPSYFDQDDSLADSSNWGPAVDIAAPGTCIWSTLSNGTYGFMSGTSMAAPHVAGAAAILAARNNPNNRLNVFEIRKKILENGNYNWTDTHPVANSTNTGFEWSADSEKEPLLDVSNSSVFFNPHPGNVHGIGVTSHAEDAMQLFANAGGALWEKDFNPWANPWGWQPWKPNMVPVNPQTGQTIPIVGAPAVISRHSCCRDVFVRGSDNQLYFRNWNSSTGSWSAWFWIPGPNNQPITDSPAAVKSELTTDGLSVVVRGSDGNIHIKNYTPAQGWWSWVSLGTPPGGAISGPAITIHGGGVTHVMVRGAGGAIWDRAWSSATGWTGWVSLGGNWPSGPAIATTRNKQDIHVFARGYDNTIWHRRYVGASGAWADWVSLGGQSAYDPTAVSRTSTNMEVFMVGLDGKVQGRRFTGSTWSKWMRIDDDCPPGAC